MDTSQLANLASQGIIEIHEVNGSVVGIIRFMFTHAILAEIDITGCYERRWCYKTKREAVDALNAWVKSDDEEPDGWIRRTHIHDEHPEGFKAGDRMSDVIHGRWQAS